MVKSRGLYANEERKKKKCIIMECKSYTIIYDVKGYFLRQMLIIVMWFMYNILVTQNRAKGIISFNRICFWNPCAHYFDWSLYENKTIL